MKAWMRVLEVTLTSQLSTSGKSRQFKFGNNWETGRDDLNIEVSCYKYMSSLKDTATIRISNLTYYEVVQIINGKFYNVEIKAGYRSSGVSTIFKGGVLYISNSLDDTKTNTITILCASELVARYGQSRLNLSLNSGINTYSAIRFICERAGIPESKMNISTQFKTKFLQDVMSINDTAASWIDKFCTTNNTAISSSDSITGSTVSLFDAAKSNSRLIKITKDTVDLTGGYPQLTSDGLSLTIMPTFAFMCSDVIEIDNSIIQIPVSSQSEVTKNYGYFLDKEGCYMIYEMKYQLQNRGANFSLSMTCKTRSLISNFIGAR